MPENGDDGGEEGWRGVTKNFGGGDKKNFNLYERGLPRLPFVI